MFIVEVVRWRNNSHSKKLSRQNSCSTINLSSSVRIPSVIAEIIHLVAIFLFGAACSQLVTDFGKYTIGRLRYENGTLPFFLSPEIIPFYFNDVLFQKIFFFYSPHFIAVCQPENLAELCSSNAPHTYITNYKCTGSDEDLVRESR